MKFIVQQRGEKFLVSNDTTGVVRGVHKNKGEADLQAQQLQKVHDQGIASASARITPPEDNADDDGE